MPFLGGHFVCCFKLLTSQILYLSLRPYQLCHNSEAWKYGAFQDKDLKRFAACSGVSISQSNQQNTALHLQRSQAAKSDRERRPAIDG